MRKSKLGVSVIAQRIKGWVPLRPWKVPNPFTPKSDKYQISPAASPKIYTSHSTQNLAFRSLLKWKMIILPILTLTHFVFVPSLPRPSSGNSWPLWRCATRSYLSGILLIRTRLSTRPPRQVPSPAAASIPGWLTAAVFSCRILCSLGNTFFACIPTPSLGGPKSFSRESGPNCSKPNRGPIQDYRNPSSRFRSQLTAWIYTKTSQDLSFSSKYRNASNLVENPSRILGQIARKFWLHAVTG